MNSKSNSSYSFYNLFHFLHVCLSIGLAILVVYNQLANEARFIKLEQEIERRVLTGQETTIQENRKSNENVEDEFIKYGGRITKRSTKLDLTNETFAGKSTDNNNNNNNNTNLIICLNLFQNFLRNSKDSGRIAKLNACDRLRGPPGKPGSPGPRGKIGRRGVRGPKGRPGDKGNIGKHGPPGPRGEKGFSGNVTVIGLKGDMGPRGTKGDKGNTGMKGQKGARGPKGDFGGPKGEKGERGPKGNVGQRGCPGDSFAPPSFITTPRALVFKEQDQAVLLCKTKANPFSHITWYRDGLKLLGHKGSSRGRYKVKEKVVKLRDVYKEALQCKVRSHLVTESSLIIKTSNSSDTGNYICEARNVMGVFRYQIRLLIQVYVQFTTIPSSVTVLENEDVQLSCRASGVPSPVITWYRKDGGAMPKRFRIVQGDLHITSVTKEQEGSYVCVASNVLGARKTEATITVNVFPVITFFREQLLTINESQTLTLPCNASGYPKPIISWTKSEESLPRGRSVFDSQTLKVTSAQYEDGGEYVCTANNTVGIDSKRTRVIVQVGPKIRQKPRSVEYGYEGNNKTLHFEVFALPEANTIWKKLDNTKMNERFRQESGNLVIERVQFTDSGFYKATATNILGKVEITTFLIVQEPVPPVISSSSLTSKVSLKSGSTFSMTCTAVGIPRPRLIWKYGGKNVTKVFTNASIGGLTVEIVNIKKHQAGRYTCMAINDFGVARQHVDLEVIARTHHFFYASGTGRLGTIQTFFVRQTGRYLIRAGGACGGNHSYNYGYRPGTYHGGRGATMEGEFKLSMGTTLKIVVGQKGGNSVEVKGGKSTTKSAADLGLSVEDNAGTGGGGGTFVYTASNNLLVVAGGGGGASSGYNGVDGQAGTAGTTSIGKASSKSRAGGTGGNPGQCNSASASFHGGVGAGWKGQGCPRGGKQHGERGGSRDQGWQGGRAGGMNSGSNGGPAPGAVGGFGGGGGGSEDNGASGGGGGYSGGGSGTHPSQAGGGGGSFCGGIRCRGTTGGNFKDDGFLKIIYLGP